MVQVVQDAGRQAAERVRIRREVAGRERGRGGHRGDPRGLEEVEERADRGRKAVDREGVMAVLFVFLSEE
jgi:hypothetical protein